MTSKLIVGYAITISVGLMLWWFFHLPFTGPHFALGVAFGTALWHVTYRLHTGGWD